MPRTADIYAVPAGTDAVSGATISSSAYNAFVHDVELDLNTPRPISAGGTGANNAADALINLGVTGAIASSSDTGAGLFSFVSSAQIKFAPYGSDLLKIAGVLKKIPATGILSGVSPVYINGVAGQTLVAGTNYYVYVFDNAGTLTFDFSTTGHSTSIIPNNVGTEVKTGDESRSLVGWVRPVAGPIFQYDLTWRAVRSWFNRRAERLDLANHFAAQRSATSTSPVEIDANVRLSFFSWANEKIDAHLMGSISGNTNGMTCFWTIGLDTQPQALGQGGHETNVLTVPVASNWNSAAMSLVIGGAAEGWHYITVFGWSSAGTIIFGTASVFNTLNGVIHT